MDAIIRELRAGFGKEDHVITDAGMEYKYRSLNVVFVDFLKAFDSLHRDSLWKILRHYGCDMSHSKTSRNPVVPHISAGGP